MALVTQNNKFNIPSSGQINKINKPKGFGDDLGLDDWDPNKEWDNGKNKLIIPQSGQTRGFGDDLGLDDYDPNRVPPTGRINIQGGNQTRGFGDDLGLDDFDLSLPSPSRLTNQNNSTRGFGDDLGLDDFSPNKNWWSGTGKIKIPNSGQVRGFGDDLGLDGFDPSRVPPSGKINMGSNTMGGSGMRKIPQSGKILK
jgi:hypothetical protein